MNTEGGDSENFELEGPINQFRLEFDTKKEDVQGKLKFKDFTFNIGDIQTSTTQL